MDKFKEDFETGEIHVRDKWQFELKSEFSPAPSLSESVFTQEFYVFIPNALQINDQTYSKERFYEDQTNLIRYKTPKFTFAQLTDPSNSDSPLIRLNQFLVAGQEKELQRELERELKLFANVFRSTLRDSIHLLLEEIERANDQEYIASCCKIVQQLVKQVDLAFQLYEEERLKLAQIWTEEEDLKLLGYVKDYMSISFNSFFSILLEAIRQTHDPAFREIDDILCKRLKEEKKYREERCLEPLQIKQDSYLNESILYQSGLLNKFFLDVLLLNTSRAAIDQKYRNIIGGIAAAIAMTVYILLFIWQGAVFVLNSEPFILFTIIIYVLKDRLKDELKTISFNQAFRWFSDYKTEIISPSGNFVVGELKESFSFINEKNVPEQISSMRNREFHSHLETIKRPERVIYYKKNIVIFKKTVGEGPPRLNALNIIFRYDIHRFLTKASDPYEPHITLDSETLEVSRTELPKIYHVNIILKNTVIDIQGVKKTELQKFRLIVDKEGIKRVENIAHNGETEKEFL